MKDKDLRIFSHLIRVKSFTKTAVDFGITQPTVSLAIKRLEKQFKQRLIFQSNNQSTMMLTNAGRILYLKANKILNEIDKMQYDVEHANDRTLRIAFCGFGGEKYMADIVDQFHKHKLTKMLVTKYELASTAFNELDHGELDAMVYSWSNPVKDSNYIIKTLTRGELSIIVPMSHHLAYRNNISINELRHENFLIREPGNYTRDVLLSLCHNAGFKPKIAFTPKSRQLMIQLVERGMGIALVVDKVVENNHHVKVIKLSEEQKRWMYIQIAIRRDLIPNSLQKRGIKILQNFKDSDS